MFSFIGKCCGLRVLCAFIYINIFQMELSEETFMEAFYDKDVVEEAFLNVEELIQKYQYPVEKHLVTTEDNYILTLHRIPKPNAQPVLLMHGLMDSSVGWILLGPNQSLGYYLYDNDYDVWMGNARGTRYSKNHTYFNPEDDKSYWKFSWHEIGVYDLPAMIDYILNLTGFHQLAYFGHSQGTTAFWVLASMRPEYNEKILIMHALAPVAFCSNMKTPLLDLGRLFIPILGENEIPVPMNFTYKYCLLGPTSTHICRRLLNELLGPENGIVDYDKYLPLILGHVPAGACVKQVKHYLQLVDSDTFQQYDFGQRENIKHYGDERPPEYPLRRITAPVALYYAQNDYLSHDLDVQRLKCLLPNVIEDHLYPYKDWNHVSMTWGKNARKLSHERMLELTAQMLSRGKNYSQV